ncbi:MAG: pyridoxamine 5'-phosphate oxidase family protein [Tepidisphaeraceae bacterium]
MEKSPDRLEQLKTLSALLREENTLALATVDEQGEVSVAPLFYLVDENLCLFWLSSPSSLHSQNLKKMPRAAATVYRHTESWIDIRGVQMRGLATVVTDRRRRRLLIKSYSERFKLGTLFLPAISRCSLYEFRPDFFRFIDNSVGFGYKFEFTPENDDTTLSNSSGL